MARDNELHCARLGLMNLVRTVSLPASAEPTLPPTSCSLLRASSINNSQPLHRFFVAFLSLAS